MKLLAAALALVLAAPACADALLPTPPRSTDYSMGPFPTLVIRGVTIIEGNGGPPFGPADIVIKGDRIAEIRSAGTPGLPMKPNRPPQVSGLAGAQEIDATGMYVLPGIPEFVRDHVVAAADVMTPNHFELNFLTGRESSTLDEVLDAAGALRAQGPEVVLVTSVVVDGAADDTVMMVAVDGEGAWGVTTPLLGRTFTGSGDLTAAMFLAALLATGSPERAVGRTADVVYSVLERTTQLDQRELALVAAQDDLVSPRFTFEVTRLR